MAILDKHNKLLAACIALVAVAFLIAGVRFSSARISNTTGVSGSGTVGQPAYFDTSISIAASSTLAVSVGGTGVQSVTAGSLLVGNGSGALTSTSTLTVSKGGTGATSLTAGSLLVGAGTGAITSTSTLSVDKGGTGATSLSSGDLLVGAGTGAITSTSTLSVPKGGTGAVSFTADSVLVGNGTGALTASSSLGINVAPGSGGGASANTSSGWVSQIEGNTAQLVIPHRLSGTPSKIAMHATTQICNGGGTLAWPGYSFGTSTAALTAFTYSYTIGTTGTEAELDASSTSIIFFQDPANTVIAAAYVQAINSTNIVLNWSINTAACVTNGNIPNPVRLINWFAEL